MNGLEIKEYRVKKGLTQEALAQLIGVSKNTILNYEKGKVIPESKNALLENILIFSEHNIATKIHNTEYQNLTGYDKKITEIEDQIKHHYEIIKLLKEKIDIIRSAKHNHANNL
ncbi:helix-turn-helix domain-containing protein [Flavobacterium sp. CSZ]|uniref:helix-turn-helix transcriptional regulator n=1 Tax=Flavobacterium sp. CSZ TaxID=2783791 RepID=UPI00188C993B|nr:helix-turn-helix domain-containing protein [Flavobacterium sp. CSZ]MBF4484401.1 helix-turn-helix transcriptional regulator [Flavobacterium sp. CSZ]